MSQKNDKNSTKNTDFIENLAKNLLIDENNML